MNETVLISNNEDLCRSVKNGRPDEGSSLGVLAAWRDSARPGVCPLTHPLRGALILIRAQSKTQPTALFLNRGVSGRPLRPWSPSPQPGRDAVRPRDRAGLSFRASL